MTRLLELLLLIPRRCALCPRRPVVERKASLYVVLCECGRGFVATSRREALRCWARIAGDREAAERYRLSKNCDWLRRVSDASLLRGMLEGEGFAVGPVGSSEDVWPCISTSGDGFYVGVELERSILVTLVRDDEPVRVVEVESLAQAFHLILRFARGEE